jgi:transcriptional regulator with XRE-family HTH domain
VEKTLEIDNRIADRLAHLRSDRGWSLEAVATRSGISRATLSRLERCELSPTAAMLGKLCSVYGWTLSRLMTDAESRPVSFVHNSDQLEWRDPASGYRRRMISPPSSGFRGELVEVRIPSGATISFENAPVPGLEHHLWIIEGALHLEVGGSQFDLRTGDCVRYILNGPSQFKNPGRRETRYIVAMVHP